jgi:hypothetical protein
MVQIELIGIPEFKKFMEEKQARLKVLLPESIRKATLYLHGQVKTSIARGTNAPVAVDTGRFLNSVDFDSSGNEARVFTDLEYAKFIEYGTIKMGSRPHFRNTAFKEQGKIRDDMGAEIGNGLKWIKPTGKASI